MICNVCYREVGSLIFHLPSCVSMIHKPRCPRMTNASCRRLTFPTRNAWPVEDFVVSGFYYTGEGDVLCCHWCNGRVSNWEDGDDAQERHLNENPNCLYAWLLCKSISYCVNCRRMVPERSGRKKHSDRCLQTAINFRDSPGPGNSRMSDRSIRLKSFKEWRNPSTCKEKLADAGFYYSGQGDWVICFQCDGSLHQWQPNDIPLEEHVFHFPECQWARRAFQNLHKNPFLKYPITQPLHPEMLNPINRLQSFKDDKSSALAQSGFFWNRQMVKCFWCGFEMNSMDADKLHIEKRPECMFIQNFCNLKNEDRLMCTICTEKEREVVFENCGHMVCCESCAQQLNTCAVCRQVISNKRRVYLS